MNNIELKTKKRLEFLITLLVAYLFFYGLINVILYFQPSNFIIKDIFDMLALIIIFVGIGTYLKKDIENEEKGENNE